MPDNLDQLLPGEFYHVYNRAVGSEKLFLNAENYSFFLAKCNKYLSSIADTFCYCLLPNHFHFFLRIKELPELEQYHEELKGKRISLLDAHVVNQFLVDQFGNLCSSYAKSFNKVYCRKGRLFIDPFKRKNVNSESYFNSLIFYIHANAVHHGYCKHLEEWAFSSYHQFVQSTNLFDMQFKVQVEEVLGWFGSIDHFKEFHQQTDTGKSIFD